MSEVFNIAARAIAAAAGQLEREAKRLVRLADEAGVTVRPPQRTWRVGRAVARLMADRQRFWLRVEEPDGSGLGRWESHMAADAPERAEWLLRGLKAAWRPRLALEVVRALEWAAEWCRRRRWGLQRHLRQVLDAQRNALRELEARAALSELGGGDDD